MVIWRKFQILSFDLGPKPPHAEVNAKPQLQYESNQHPLVNEKCPGYSVIPFPLGDYSLVSWPMCSTGWSSSRFKKKKEKKKENQIESFTGVDEFGAASVAALQRGVWGRWGEGKQGKERAKLSSGLGRVRGNRQNIPPSVIGASHGYRSEQRKGGLQGNFIPHKVRVILSWSSAHRPLWKAFFGGWRGVCKISWLNWALLLVGSCNLSVELEQIGHSTTTTQVKTVQQQQQQTLFSRHLWPLPLTAAGAYVVYFVQDFFPSLITFFLCSHIWFHVANSKQTCFQNYKLRHQWTKWKGPACALKQRHLVILLPTCNSFNSYISAVYT